MKSLFLLGLPVFGLGACVLVLSLSEKIEQSPQLDSEIVSIQQVIENTPYENCEVRFRKGQKGKLTYEISNIPDIRESEKIYACPKGLSQRQRKKSKYKKLSHPRA